MLARRRSIQQRRGAEVGVAAMLAEQIRVESWAHRLKNVRATLAACEPSWTVCRLSSCYDAMKKNCRGAEAEAR
jgi:hypothetical protein